MGTIPPRREWIRAVRGVKPRGGRYLQLYAADLGRDPDGRWWVLDDRAQASIGHRLCAGDPLVLSRAYPNLYNAMNVHRSAGSGAGWDVAREKHLPSAGLLARP